MAEEASVVMIEERDDELEAMTIVVVSVEDCRWDVDDDVLEDDGGTVVVTVDDDGDCVELLSVVVVVTVLLP
jgi:hypothetical protein